jgi:hypothetical protein
MPLARAIAYQYHLICNNYRLGYPREEIPVHLGTCRVATVNCSNHRSAAAFRPARSRLLERTDEPFRSPTTTNPGSASAPTSPGSLHRPLHRQRIANGMSMSRIVEDAPHGVTFLGRLLELRLQRLQALLVVVGKINSRRSVQAKIAQAAIAAGPGIAAPARWVSGDPAHPQFLKKAINRSGTPRCMPRLAGDRHPRSDIASQPAEKGAHVCPVETETRRKLHEQHLELRPEPLDLREKSVQYLA